MTVNRCLWGYVEGLVSVIGHADRAGPLRDYCVGLMLPCERKSVEPAPERTAAQHQSLLHFVGNAGWSDERVLAKVRAMVLPEVERHGPIEAWIIDDTGFPKQGRHSVGVTSIGSGGLLEAAAFGTVILNGSLVNSGRLCAPTPWSDIEIAAGSVVSGAPPPRAGYPHTPKGRVARAFLVRRDTPGRVAFSQAIVVRPYGCSC
jgi:DDE superfamily endonuclease